MIGTEPRTEARPGARGQRSERKRGIALGVLAGVLGLGCCVAPTGAALLGLTSAAVAVDVGNSLYGDWGWAFKGAALAFAGGAVWIQRRRAAACSLDMRPDIRQLTLWLVVAGLGAYGLAYAGTKALARFA